MTAFLTIFRRFPTTFRRFPKILQNLSEGHTNISEENFQRLPKITEDCRRFSRKTRRCFNHSPMNLSTILKTILISAKSLMSSLVRIWKIYHPSLGCGSVWILRVVYFPVNVNYAVFHELCDWMRFDVDWPSQKSHHHEYQMACEIMSSKIHSGSQN